MKKLYLTSTFIFVLCTAALSLCSCQKEEIDLSLTFWNVPADLTITNLSTGTSTQKSSSDMIIFKHGEVLQLKFTPPESYKNSKFTVRFVVLDVDTQVYNSPYVYDLTIANDVPIGTYVAVCDAMCEEWSEGSNCSKTIHFRVEE